MQNNQLFTLAGVEATSSPDLKGCYLTIVVKHLPRVNESEDPAFLYSVSCTPVRYDSEKKEYFADARQLLFINNEIGSGGASSKKRFFYNFDCLVLETADGAPFPYVITVNRPKEKGGLALDADFKRYTP